MADRGKTPTGTPTVTPTLTLANDAALSLLSRQDLVPDATRLVVVGTSPLRMALAEVAFPEAELVCADPGQSAALAMLEDKLRAMGRLDRLVLAGDGADSAAIFALMRVIVAFVPALRSAPGGSIHLAVRPGASVGALRQFLRRMQPTMDRQNIDVRLVVLTAVAN
ncbi:hypothetical protein [Tabrizicola thermarum]|uniref:hypothetical protein n=1 Tax=Tabrizicola thermarum TaxID=2670345 RepID=UPI000FFC3584|nr:hypothetical protein [Tabrizicola thermarum]